jgi:alcohol dehydrogenase class IV
MEVNVRALRTRQPGSPALSRYEEVARLLTGRSHATAEEGVSWIVELCRRLEIPPLRAYGVTESDVPDVAEKAAKASSMKGNPIALTPQELHEILTRAL